MIAAPENNDYGCDEMIPQIHDGLPPIALIRGGGDPNPCKLTQKVLNAQHANASAVLIADNVEETLITMDSGDDAEYVQCVQI